MKVRAHLFSLFEKLNNVIKITVWSNAIVGHAKNILLKKALLCASNKRCPGLNYKSK